VIGDGSTTYKEVSEDLEFGGIQLHSGIYQIPDDKFYEAKTIDIITILATMGSGHTLIADPGSHEHFFFLYCPTMSETTVASCPSCQ